MMVLGLKCQQSYDEVMRLLMNAIEVREEPFLIQPTIARAGILPSDTKYKIHIMDYTLSSGNQASNVDSCLSLLSKVDSSTPSNNHFYWSHR